MLILLSSSILGMCWGLRGAGDCKIEMIKGGDIWPWAIKLTAADPPLYKAADCTL